MKHLSRLLSLLILVSAGVFFANCGGGGGEDPNPQQEALDKLVGTWTVSSATLNGSPKAEFEDAKLNITSAKVFNFTQDVGSIDASPWPASVSWDFGSDINTTITRKDAGGNIPLTYSVSGNTLTIHIDDYTGESYAIGRVESVEGDWVFTFSK
jgi:hypothetical protein